MPDTPKRPISPVNIEWSAFTERMKMILWRAGEHAGRRDSHYIGTEDLAQALLEETKGPHVSVVEEAVISRIRKAIGHG